MSFDENKEMLEGFVADSREMIEEIEPKLIELQQSSEACGAADKESINSIFRLFHSLKGAAGFLNLTNITGVTHEAETLLNLIREDKFPLAVNHTNILCEACDLLLSLLTNIEEQGTDQVMEEQIETIVKTLSEHSKGGSTVESTETSAIEEQSPEISLDNNETGEEISSTTPEETEIKITVTPEMLSSFIQESDELLESVETVLVNLDNSANKKEYLDHSFRSIHSFKGNCGFMGFKDPERLSHKAETVLSGMRDGTIECSEGNIGILLPVIDSLRNAVAELSRGGSDTINGCDIMFEVLEGITGTEIGEKKTLRLGEILVASEAASPEAVEKALNLQGKPVGDILVELGDTNRDAVDEALKVQQAQSPQKKVVRRDIRVDLDKLDVMIDLVGELVIAQLMVTHNPDLKDYELENFSKASHHLQRITSELQDVSMAVRMVPLSATFRKMIRLVHDLSNKFGKKVKLNLKGEETEVDKTVIEQISDPLVHIIRNAIDHGVETSDKRLSKGKDETGIVSLDARHDGGEVLITIQDDGAGLDRDKIFEKGIKQGLVTEENRSMSNEDVFKLIFEPGFSTAEKVTDVSGRGVGMDVVKRNLEKIKGHADIKSELGKGSTFTLRIPLTLAIVEGMLVRTGEAHYIIPLLAIRESFRPDQENITILPDGREMVRVREELIPVTRIHSLYNVKSDYTELHEGILVIVENQGENICLFLDEVVGQQQTVIKALPSYMSTIQGVSGCSILGDGQVCLILDVGSIIKKSKKVPAELLNR